MDRIELCREKFKELFGGEPVKNEGTDPEFMRILQRFIFGEICYTGDLDNQIRELITIVVLAVNQTLPQLKAHTQASLNVGCTPVEIREAIYQCAPFIGFPKTLNAIAVINEVFTEQKIALPIQSQETIPDDQRYQAGLAVQEQFYGNEWKGRYEWLTEEYAEAVPRFLTEFCFGDFATRTGLDAKRRELLILVIHAALGCAGDQIKSHTKGAMKAGNTPDTITGALLHAMPYMGFPRLLDALNAVGEILEGE
ncbi:alkylhydroperoxidase AhpD family core domain protein [Marvinbryantia formatexigens DSM 14469]|uniref:Alkylhydroperoxidase AhpD family core domain protein n=1 Tax=Marvinbryantia formatexigens DSM 14469 TaxID=478749 RepID=C6LEA0_9FIRM|nr:carboxymuconolactone decarboxylase family protein [Marvinbryantia formatexigens]EET60883.1 alkylhydroperoxidase AhpD family core domain protein [Marvinbryantia formatexigens DSM 14469]UWO24811.1 carboxymuconolactone decarboxylase family protein [Marvinbryantia formatexigens DSM 14469]SDF24405.1 4-carboxymuconolactone decarboxylase [Marvinbryantia formatexigens]